MLLGDGAAGFSLMDADTLVRHRLPVVMICGNNGIWGLEKHPMRAIYGYDVAADLQPMCRYDDVVRALGGAGELVEYADWTDEDRRAARLHSFLRFQAEHGEEDWGTNYSAPHGGEPCSSPET